MGTRADFYLGEGGDAEWLGSVAYEGERIHQHDLASELTLAVEAADTPDEFRAAVRELIATEFHGTQPEQGWPWPWQDSCTTDYAYCFVHGLLHCYRFGHGPVMVGQSTLDTHGDYAKPKAPFPDMTARQRVTYGERSGLLLMRG